MEIVKKFGLWILAAVIAIGAIVVYFLFVNTVAGEVSTKRGDIEKRRDELKTWAQKGKDIPNPTKIEIAKKNAEQVAAGLDQCELYLALQPRWAHTIRFFTEGPFGPEIEIPLNQPNNWLKLYRQHNLDLQNQLNAAGMAYTVRTMDWGTSVPPPEDIAAAMELYWFQKDLIDFLTQQVEKDFAAYLEFKARDRADAFPAKPFDLVVNRKPARLDDFLRSASREKLVAVLGAIVVNRQQQDLATIFNALLPDEKRPDGTVAVYGFPWERPASEKEHGSVRGFTMDEQQEKFLAEMLPPGKPDLSNRQRFLDYVMELRMVRYRADVVGLLESHHVEGHDHFDSLAASLRRGTDVELDGILRDIADINGVWNTTAIAEAISAIVSINNEEDFRLVRNNHAPNIAALLSLTMGEAGETSVGTSTGMPGGPGMGRQPMPGGPAATGAPGNDLYKLRTFEMQVKLEFERIPVFLRRLISNSWRYRVHFTEIAPIEATATSGGTPATLPGMRPGAGMQMRGESQSKEPETVEAGNYVILKLNGEAYQFTPLMNKYRDKLENRASPAAPVSAPAGRPAPPTGAR